MGANARTEGNQERAVARKSAVERDAQAVPRLSSNLAQEMTTRSERARFRLGLARKYKHKRQSCLTFLYGACALHLSASRRSALLALQPQDVVRLGIAFRAPAIWKFLSYEDLVSPTSRSPVKLGLPAQVIDRWFPRLYHRYSFGDKVAWWEKRAIDALATSRMLWVSSRRIE